MAAPARRFEVKTDVRGRQTRKLTAGPVGKLGTGGGNHTTVSRGVNASGARVGPRKGLWVRALVWVHVLLGSFRLRSPSAACCTGGRLAEPDGMVSTSVAGGRSLSKRTWIGIDHWELRGSRAAVHLRNRGYQHSRGKTSG